MKDKQQDDEEQKPPLARWASIVQPASLSTKTGKHRFVVTIKLPEKSLKTASNFVKEMNEALKIKMDATAPFLLVDSDRARLQRATANFCTFKESQTCIGLLKELGLPVNDISAELENFGKKQYDPWYESISQAWWPWLASWRNPPPEMSMMKVTNRLDVAEGGKYSEKKSGKLGKGDEGDRDEPPVEEKKKSGKKKSGKTKPAKEDAEGEE